MDWIKLDGPDERTLHGMLEWRARRQADAPWVWFRERVITYGELDGDADRVAAGLAAQGVAKGVKVAVMLANRPAFLAAWFGLSKLGAVEVPVNTAHRGYLLSYLLGQADCEVLIVEAAFADRVSELMAAAPDALPRLRTVVVLDMEPGALPLPGRTVMSWRALVSNDGRFERPAVRWSDAMGIQFTSGTTGPSKGAVLPHNYAVQTAESVCAIARYRAEDCLYNALPLFHGNAKFLSAAPSLLAGTRMVLGERFSARIFWDDVRRHGCTEFNYIGSILAILLKAEPRADDADNPLRVLFGAGATPEVHEAFERRFGVRLIEGYGMSEIGLALVSDPDDPRPGSCGKPHPDCEVVLVDDDGAPVGDGTPGELLVRPKRPWSMLLEYYGMPEKTVAAWQGLWFHTGDTLVRDAEGFYRFIDRKKDAIRRRGENISSFEVERLVVGHPAVLEAAALPVSSELGEDEVMVCVVRRPGERLEAQELVDYCKGLMAGFMVPRYVRFLDALPKTPTEKVQKFRLREEGVTPDTWDRERAGVECAS
ncbi:AMP-binding protein [Thauera sinica]|uniref:AMP-binding protein n=1 Tax=Thauera sinica TaxID=2665146 RepID=A0ABW1AX53_9RHOO|nr:AMP-binding protein [Thauera sp. K11]